MWLGLWKPGISADSAQITQVQKMILFFWCVFMIFMFCKLLLLSYWYVNKAWRFYCHSFCASKDIVRWTSKISLNFVCRYALFLQVRSQFWCGPSNLMGWWQEEINIVMMAISKNYALKYYTSNTMYIKLHNYHG